MRTFPGCALPVLGLGLGVLLVLAGCEPEVPGGVITGSEESCSPERRVEVSAEAYFEQTMVPTVFEPYCSRCHWSTLSADARHGAPVGVDYDDFTAATARNGTTWFRVRTYNMPPMGRVPNLDEMAVLNEWLNCTFPTGDDDDSAGDDDDSAGDDDDSSR